MPRARRRSKRLEQRLDLTRRQRGGRLVEHEHPGVPCERLCDLDQLLAPDAQPLDRRVEVDGHVQALQGTRGTVAHGAAIDRAETARLVSEHDVFGNREWCHERELLVHHGDARHFGIANRAEPAHLAVEQHLAGVRRMRVHAAEHSQQRGLAGAVLANQRVDLARAQIEVHPVERAHAGKGLADAAHLEERTRERHLLRFWAVA